VIRVGISFRYFLDLLIWRLIIKFLWWVGLCLCVCWVRLDAFAGWLGQNAKRMEVL
jgi:hypothetical protein